MTRKAKNPFEDCNLLFEELQKGIKTLVSKTPESLIELSKYGWYTDFDIIPRVLIELSDQLRNGEVESVDNYFSEYYSKKLNRIKDKLCLSYPQRKKILKEAFNCYKKKRYYATISLLLTQADGFCYDKTEALYFRNNKELRKEGIYRTEVEEKIKRMSGGMLDILLKPMKKATLINEDTRNLEDFPVKLNRHAILHGMITDYGTSTNCLKIISFINYLDDILEKNIN